jgi:hypothetical protein
MVRMIFKWNILYIRYPCKSTDLPLSVNSRAVENYVAVLCSFLLLLVLLRERTIAISVSLRFSFLWPPAW